VHFPLKESSKASDLGRQTRGGHEHVRIEADQLVRLLTEYLSFPTRDPHFTCTATVPI
jgi:hypothetical protein